MKKDEYERAIAAILNELNSAQFNTKLVVSSLLLIASILWDISKDTESIRPD